MLSQVSESRPSTSAGKAFDRPWGTSFVGYQEPIRCLILACGNSLRGDDGVGPWLAAWAEERFRGNAGVRVIARQQWTPELAEEISRSPSVLFVDSSLEADPGRIQVAPVAPELRGAGLATHHLCAAELLGLCQELFDFLPRSAVLLTVGAGSTDLAEGFSDAVKAALPNLCAEIEKFVSGEEGPIITDKYFSRLNPS